MTELKILNTVGKSLPFAVSDASGEKEEIKEETRLEHRVLDLRRPEMARNLKLRHDTLRALRRVLEDEYGFLEVETPTLTRSTPEGARDYLVPSRLQPGRYAAANRRNCLNKCSWWPASIDIIRWRGVSETRIYAPIANPSSRSWTSRWRSRTRKAS